jgi:hypothetical protein
MKPAPVAAILTLLLCGGCSIALDERSGVYAAQPGKYDFLDCPGIQKRAAESAKREAELSGLMQRASRESAGTVVNALVYRDEFNMVRSDRQALQKAADEKRCLPDIRPQGAGMRSLY